MTDEAYYPEPQELEAYGNGGFRFADFSHKGSVLILPDGIYGWDYKSFEDVGLEAFAPVLNSSAPLEFLIFGTGVQQSFPSPDILKAFIEAKIGLEVMDTGAAARTFNILHNEGRQIAAALLAVD